MNKAREFLALLRSLAREWKWLAGYIRRYAKEVLFYILIGVSGTIMGLGASVASKYLIDAVVAKRPAETVYAGALVIALALVQLCVNAGTNRLSSRIGTRVRSEIRSAIFEHIVYARWEQIRGYHSGDLINRLEGDVATVANGVVSYIPNLVTRLTQFVGCLAIVLYYDPTMAVFALVSAPFMFLSSEVSAKMMRKYNRESREMNGKLLSFSSETIQNLQAIKAFDLTRRYAARFQEMMGQIRRMQLEHNRYSVRLTFCMSLLGLLVSYSCYGWGVWRLWQGAITYGTMTLFIQISGNLTSSRLRCVRPASALSGTYFFPLASFLSIWHDIPESFPLPRCRWQTAYCVLLISVRFMIIVTVVKSRPVAGGICLESEVFPQPMGFLTAGRRAEAVKMP